MHIAIAGNIGAGKTTLAGLLASHYGWEALKEMPDENPYLADFYEDMPRWAFQVQVHFLTSRFDQLMQISQAKHSVIQDRTIYEDAFVFAKNLHDSEIMSTQDYQTYHRLFDIIMQLVRPPDLLIFLDAGLPKLTLQVKKRGRLYEQSVDVTYLATLQKHYQNWIRSYQESPMLYIDVNELDFLNKPEDFQMIVQKINQRLSI
ncbi:deoxynucleoside kinase [Cytophagaceae bacterium DM2B3-1]|uniref:Deoxynucleoside kinase n=1 Tax=Xanthocytophaga flava TaxID=3048013 RepID=A0ABT7CG69_9BACT|nr:deoxynucleoside kinase [Xanthocytophaga flavus]MDJ1473578.1 deoxynucleoside kinase [Xanthocytophaga flavus]MDJ1492735.1 deoxynucleoside kinase [Xanthocytophaga flavus]